MDNKVLILEDNTKLAIYYARLLLNAGFKVETTSNSDDFMNKYANFSPDVILLDVRLKNSQLNGIEVFEKILRLKDFYSKAIILSGEATRSEIAKAMKMGAYTFIEKSGNFNVDKFIADVRAACQLKKQSEQAERLTKERNEYRKAFIQQNPFIGKSDVIQKVKEEIKRFAKADIDVMILGDTGTGKEVVADHIYWNSGRIGKPFVKVNTGGISDSLVDSELFGHKKGSFTGAHYNRKGCFEQANGGYLMLDEIGSINAKIQAKILRSIENKKIRIIGGETKKIDVKIIFASNKDLQELVQSNQLRKDLYYRIAKNGIFLPPLREREDDIVLLMEYFLNLYSRNHKSHLEINLNQIKNFLLDYTWPGNVRELSSFCENLTIRHKIISNEIIIEEINKKSSGKYPKEIDPMLNLLKTDKLSEAVDKFEKKYMKYHLELNNNNISKTAKNIGIERTTFYRKMK